MSTPVLLVTGFLGAGKTTAINRLLAEAGGQRIAAIVNDFGAINIDAELLADAADTVIGLQNGCICCSLQGDLLRTLRLVLGQTPPPERIVIEASGAADPRGIIETIMDPALWDAVELDAVVCLVDAADLAATPGRVHDPLWRAQMQFSDFVLLCKTQGVDPQELLRLGMMFASAGKPMFDIDALPLPADVLFGRAGGGARAAVAAGGHVHADRFVTVEWHAPAALSLAAFQDALGAHGQGLLRAKGFVTFTERPGQRYLFQLVGQRASFTPVAAGPAGDGPPVRLVFIGARGSFAAQDLLDALGPAPG